MANKAVKPGLYQAVVGVDGDVHGEEVAKRKDRSPTKNQTGREEKEREQATMGRGKRKTEAGDPLKSDRDAETDSNDEPQEPQGAPVFHASRPSAGAPEDGKRKLRAREDSYERSESSLKCHFVSEAYRYRVQRRAQASPLQRAVRQPL